MLFSFPIRNLFFADFGGNQRGEAALYASYVMLFLFCGLTLVFGWRLIKLFNKN
jgi:hypothetical protein